MTYYLHHVEITQKEKDYILPKVSDDKRQLPYYNAPNFLYLSRVVFGVGELVECPHCKGSGKQNIREEWYTNCNACTDSGVPGPDGKWPKIYEEYG